VHAAFGESLDSGLIGERLEKPDQYLPLAQPADLIRSRFSHLDDGVGVPDACIEGRACLGIRGIRKGGGYAGPGLDDDVEPALHKA